MNNIIFLLKECPTNFEILKVLSFILIILKIVFFIVPIGLIVIITIDFAKNVIAGKEDEMKKNVGIVIKRFVYCIALFLVPTIVGAFNSILGDLGVPYSNYLECANSEDIKLIINNQAAQLVQNAEENLDFVSYDEASNVIAQIEDEDLRKEYQERLDIVKSKIDENNKNSITIPDSGISIDDNSSIEVNYPDAVIENLASFIGSENGGHPDGFLAQLLTGAVYINNFYTNINKDINTTTMCEMFSFKSAYTPTYCNYTFAKLEANRGPFPESQKEQLIIVAKIILSKTFTIPKDIIYQAADYIITESNGTIWETAPTGIGLNAYFGYSNYNAPIVGKDIYGKDVSTNIEDYRKLADQLYNKYVKNN